MSIENKIELLWNCANILKADAQACKLLKSHYINTCRYLARNSVQIPKEKFALSQMCPHCSCFWTESEFSLKLKSQHLTNNAKTSKLIEKFNKSKDPDIKGLLSRKQKNRAKWLKKRVTNYMEINCHQCKHKSFVKMEKPKNKTSRRIDEKNAQSKESENVVEEHKIKPKKKKIKCKTAGLKIPQENGAEIKEHSKKIETKLATAPTKQPQGVDSNLSHKHQISKIKKNNKSMNNNNGILPLPKTKNKIISKTQQQNSLMQLATLLKNQSASDDKNSTQKRLESLLK